MIKPMTKWALCFLVCTGCAVQGELSFSAALVDFGDVLPGSEHRDSIVLTNKGNASQVIAGWSSTNPTFALDFPERLTLSPQESRTLSVRHVPPIGATQPELADLRVWSDEGLAAAFHARSLPTEPELIKLSMRNDVAIAASYSDPRIPVTDDCTLPSPLDFGSVFSGETKTIELLLRNSGAEAVGAWIELSSTSNVFAADEGSHLLPPGASKSIQLTFSPVDVNDYTASLLVTRPRCPPKTLRLDGKCVVNPNPLTWTPITVNFAAVVGSTVTKVVTLQNKGSTPIELSNVETREATSPPVFSVTRYPLRVPAAQSDGAGMLLPGEATVELSYHPTRTGQRAGTLTMDTDLPEQPSISIDVRGSSGLP